MRDHLHTHQHDELGRDRQDRSADGVVRFTVVGDGWEPSDTLLERLADLLLDLTEDDLSTFKTEGQSHGREDRFINS